MIFETPEEAIAACQAGSEEAWKEFSTANNIKPEVNQEAYDITKKVFSAGYTFGIQFISGKLTELIIKSQAEKKS
jgi:hypothetical protein